MSKPSIVVNRDEFIELLSSIALVKRKKPKFFDDVSLRIHPEGKGFVSQITPSKDTLVTCVVNENFFIENNIGNKEVKVVFPVSETISALKELFRGIPNITIEVENDNYVIYRSSTVKYKVAMPLPDYEYSAPGSIESPIGYIHPIFYPVIQYEVFGSELRVMNIDRVAFKVSGNQLSIVGVSRDKTKEYERNIEAQRIVSPLDIVNQMKSIANEKNLDEKTRGELVKKIELYNKFAESSNFVFNVFMNYDDVKTIYDIFRNRTILLGFSLYTERDVNAVVITIPNTTYVLSIVTTPLSIEEEEVEAPYEEIEEEEEEVNEDNES